MDPSFPALQLPGNCPGTRAVISTQEPSTGVTLLPRPRSSCSASDPLRCSQGPWATPAHAQEALAVHGPSASPSSSGSAALTYAGPSLPPRGSPQPLTQVASIPHSAAAARISHLVPTHTGWVMYTLCADVRGRVCIHMGYRSYIHCAYIYTYSIYIYIFLHSYI